MRRIALDDATVEILTEHRERYEEITRQLGQKPRDEAFIFSYKLPFDIPCDPSAVTHVAPAGSPAQVVLDLVGLDHQTEAVTAERDNSGPAGTEIEDAPAGEGSSDDDRQRCGQEPRR